MGIAQLVSPYLHRKANIDRMRSFPTELEHYHEQPEGPTHRRE